MLVLSRKVDEQILIGDDIKITLVRVRGGSVRLGIDAPREIRVVRGELAGETTNATGEGKEDEAEPYTDLDPVTEVFAHPQPHRGLTSESTVPSCSVAANRIVTLIGKQSVSDTSAERASIKNDDVHLRHAPLAGFMSAS